MQRILVTGGCGFIGSNFIRHLPSTHAGLDIVNLDKLTYAGNPENLADVERGESGSLSSRYRFVQGDIADRALVDSLLSTQTYSAVINFAAESHVDRSILDSGPFIQTNIIGTQVLLDACRKAQIPRFVQVSTDEVYGSLGPTGAFTEDTPLAPNSPYSASKASADLLVRAYHHTFGLPDARIIARGAPERSTLLHRLQIRGNGQMPQLATNVADRQAIELLRAWIESLEKSALTKR